MITTSATILNNNVWTMNLISERSGRVGTRIHKQEHIDHDDITRSNDNNHRGSRRAPPVYGDSVVRVSNGMNQSMKERGHVHVQ